MCVTPFMCALASAFQNPHVCPAAGEGAFSQVVLAKHKVTGAYVALKVVFLQNPDVDEDHMAIMMRCGFSSRSPRNTRTHDLCHILYAFTHK